MWGIEKNFPRHTRRTRAVFSLLSLSVSLLIEPPSTISFLLGRGWVEWANAGVKAEGLRLSSSKRSSHVSFLSVFFSFFSPLFLLRIPLQWKFCPCYSFVRLRRGARRFCSNPFPLASLVFLLRHSPSKFPEEQTSTTNIHGWPSRWPEQ